MTRQTCIAAAIAAFWLLLTAAPGFAVETSTVVEADVCIYGGTSGGVVAAVQAARMGKKTVLVEPGRHLGGMTAGVLSAVDIGDPRSIGGLTREYFTRLVGSYGKTLAWDQPFEGKGGPATGGAFAIEPHMAERLFDTMAKESGVPVHCQKRLAVVRKDGVRLVEFSTADGSVFREKMFLDATYEGDLMAKAGVSYTLLREGNARYSERYNGTFALSASHTAFSSIRMEPVFMVTSQSAATAACLAIDDSVPVQKVDYSRLRSRLLADQQVLEWRTWRAH